MKKLQLGFGGHPLKNDDFNWMQNAYSEVIKAIISIFDPSLNIILSGFIITDNGTTISSTDGYVSWQGEIYQVKATSFAKVAGQQLYFKLVETVVSPSPVTYKDGTNQNVHIDRTLQFKYFAAGDTGEYYAAFTRTSSLGFKRGMLVYYQGSTTANFDQTGLGINDMAGFAIANGNTYTISGGVSYTVPDLRGRKLIGATNVPATGAPTYDSTLGSYNITSATGAISYPILQANLPNYNLPVNDPGHTHIFPRFTDIGQDSGNAGADGHDLQPRTDVTQSAQTNIIVNSGGGGVKLTTLDPSIAEIPIIKL